MNKGQFRDPLNSTCQVMPGDANVDSFVNFVLIAKNSNDVYFLNHQKAKSFRVSENTTQLEIHFYTKPDCIKWAGINNLD